MYACSTCLCLGVFVIWQVVSWLFLFMLLLLAFFLSLVSVVYSSLVLSFSVFLCYYIPLLCLLCIFLRYFSLYGSCFLLSSPFSVTVGSLGLDCGTCSTRVLFCYYIPLFCLLCIFSPLCLFVRSLLSLSSPFSVAVGSLGECAVPVLHVS